MKVQESIEIAAPPERIWPFFVEPKKVMQWCITFKKFEYTSNQHSGEETPIYIEEKAGGPLMKMNFKIKECKENEKISLRLVSGSGVKSYEQTWTLKAIPSGSRFTFLEEIELPYGILNRMLNPLLERMSAGTVDKMLVRLKTLAEA